MGLLDWLTTGDKSAAPTTPEKPNGVAKAIGNIVGSISRKPGKHYYVTGKGDVVETERKTKKKTDELTKTEEKPA